MENKIRQFRAPSPESVFAIEIAQFSVEEMKDYLGVKLPTAKDLFSFLDL